MKPRPNIVISSLDLQRLETLLDSINSEVFPGKSELEAELARAEIVEPENMPANVVTMNSMVRFKVGSVADYVTLNLVYPKDVDASKGKISVLAPVGSALLGLSQGDAIEWPAPDGSLINVIIEEVLYQPERMGEFHR